MCFMHDAKTIARFWAKVSIRGSDDCWPWEASCRSTGYGQFRVNKPKRAVRGSHVIACEIGTGFSNGLQVLHSCDNRPCCNPAHLFRGTHRDNMVDLANKGYRRPPVQRGSKNFNSKLTEAEVLCVRGLIADGRTNTDIAGFYGVSHATVSLIRLGRTWKHVA